ncbi:TetR/AcrR family transcriptional regulator [Rhodococcus sp. IEGM 248]|nr:TetR/AcrR family transcriptional regulator [Rhodococcus sp. IEGM 248]
MPKIVDHEQRRRQLADAVLRVIARRGGVAAVTNREVAAESGWSTGILQHYFKSQHDLLLAALRRAAELQGSVFRELSRSEGSSLEKLERVLESVLPLDPERLALTSIFLFFYSEGVGNEVTRAEAADYLAGWRRVIRRHVVAAQADGLLPPGNPDLLTIHLVGLADGVATHALLDPEILEQLQAEPRIVSTWVASTWTLTTA